MYCTKHGLFIFGYGRFYITTDCADKMNTARYKVNKPCILCRWHFEDKKYNYIVNGLIILENFALL